MSTQSSTKVWELKFVRFVFLKLSAKWLHFSLLRLINWQDWQACCLPSLKWTYLVEKSVLNMFTQVIFPFLKAEISRYQWVYIGSLLSLNPRYTVEPSWHRDHPLNHSRMECEGEACGIHCQDLCLHKAECLLRGGLMTFSIFSVLLFSVLKKSSCYRTGLLLKSVTINHWGRLGRR